MNANGTKFTPGPWLAYNQVGNRILNNWRVGSDSSEQPGAVCRMDESLTGDQEYANAHLIASAPDLYAACTALLNAYAPNADKSAAEGGESCLHSSVRAARAALAKAEGRAEA